VGNGAFGPRWGPNFSGGKFLAWAPGWRRAISGPDAGTFSRPILRKPGAACFGTKDGGVVQRSLRSGVGALHSASGDLPQASPFDLRKVSRVHSTRAHRKPIAIHRHGGTPGSTRYFTAPRLIGLPASRQGWRTLINAWQYRPGATRCTDPPNPRVITIDGASRLLGQVVGPRDPDRKIDIWEISSRA